MSESILIIGQLPPPVHGSNVMTERFMESLKKNGYNAQIVKKTFSKELSDVGKISIKKALMIPNLCNRVKRSIKKNKPDFCIYFITVGITALLVDCFVIWTIRKLKIPYVLYFHGKGYKEFDRPQYLIVRRIIYSALKNALGGIVIGEPLKNDVNHCIPKEKLYVLPNGIPKNNVVPNFVDHKDEKITIAFLSNMIPTKGPFTFLKVAKQILNNNHKVKFIMAGRSTSDSYLKKLKEFINNNGIADFVILTGPVYGPVKDEFFSKADIFLYPTQKDALPIVLLEALQYGIPAITSPVGAIPDIVMDGVNGFLVDPTNTSLLANKIESLIEDSDLRRKMGSAGIELFQQKFSIEAYYRNTRSAMNFFSALLKNSD